MVMYCTAACSYARALAVGLVHWNYPKCMKVELYIICWRHASFKAIVCVFACCTQYNVLAYAAVSNHLV